MVRKIDRFMVRKTDLTEYTQFKRIYIIEYV